MSVVYKCHSIHIYSYSCGHNFEWNVILQDEYGMFCVDVSMGICLVWLAYVNEVQTCAWDCFQLKVCWIQIQVKGRYMLFNLQKRSKIIFETESWIWHFTLQYTILDRIKSLNNLHFHRLDMGLDPLIKMLVSFCGFTFDGVATYLVSWHKK